MFCSGFRTVNLSVKTDKMKKRFETRKKPSGSTCAKDDFNCLFCAIRDRDKQVKGLELARGKYWIVSLHRFPYNPGHLIISPLRHLTDIHDLNREEVLELHQLQIKAMEALETHYSPRGFNIGFNVGTPDGFGIEHVHCHVVPRHINETGLVEMTSGGTRCLVEDPLETLEKLRQAFNQTEL